MFAVVVPTRDRLRSLPRTLDAVHAQRRPAEETIVVDDGSADGTAEHLVGRDDVMVLRTEGVGVAAARNRGIAAATAPWVVFLDDDDVPDPGWLESLGSLVSEGVGIVSCAATLHRAGGSEVRVPRPQEGGGRALFLAGTFAVRRELLEAVGGYLEGLTYSENTELALRLVPRCREVGLELAWTDEPLLHVWQADVRRAAAGRHRAILTVLGAHEDTFRDHPDRRARLLSVAGVDAWREGDRRLSRRLLGGAVRAQPLAARNWMRLGAAVLSPLGRRLWGNGTSGADGR